MKLPILTLAAGLACNAFAGGSARAAAADAKCVRKASRTTRDEDQTVEVITAYCTCVNNKMPSYEMRSIKQWEKANKREMEACSTQVGGKGP